MNFYELFYIVVYEAIKINHCTHSYQLSSRKCLVFDSDRNILEDGTQVHSSGAKALWLQWWIRTTVVPNWSRFLLSH